MNDKKRKILDGHKRVGKRFIPPMKQLSTIKSTSYVNDILPELIWIGLLNEKYGYIHTSRMLERLFVIVDEVSANELQGSVALISAYKQLSSDHKDIIRTRLDKEGILDLIRNGIAPLTLLYDNCPLNFLGPPSIVLGNSELVMIIKSCVGKVIDKYETPGIVLNGAVLISRLVTNKIKFAPHIELPDFNSVIDSPDSDEAKHAAGFMRANALSEFAMQNIDPAWAEHFWNRGIELSPCDFTARHGCEHD